MNRREKIGLGSLLMAADILLALMVPIPDTWIDWGAAFGAGMLMMMGAILLLGNE